MVDQQIKAHLQQGKSRGDLLLDDKTELCLPAIGAFDWNYKTGDSVGAQSVDALASSGGCLLSAEIRGKAVKTSRETYKLQHLYSGKSKGSNFYGAFHPFGKGKGYNFTQA